MKPQLTTITATLLLAACSAPPETGRADSQPANKETVKMSENKTPPTTQREILERMLEMMKTSESIKDFTRERLEQVFGIKMRPHESDADSYVFSKQLTDNWWWEIEKYEDQVEKLDGFRFSFIEAFHNNHKDNEKPDFTEICDMDFDEFVQKVEKLGFTQKPVIVQDGMQMGVYLNKEDLQIEAAPWYYYPKNNPTEKRACIRKISIV
ncbi:hypothetical protein BWD09_04090 [Neisseria dentiae]|uniref:Lipoprotein n=1 Tax=Neisseria dentiae TaxID=194197 RepID=A0A1X3DE03_9NEIS|nr:hypothetical protein [Neisseria dentiae]OSI17941.1 hypothetical protein BWD09_04090 [Neisseria dentiae]QMT45079.1 hypothetical protein H3L92_11870 [Neisseria dentiae]STZ50833.1 Uncharacterised protein [Neisseria dentiae]